MLVTIIIFVCSLQKYVEATQNVQNDTKDWRYGSLLEHVGYPNSGDIPVLNRKKDELDAFETEWRNLAEDRNTCQKKGEAFEQWDVFKGTRVTIREHPYIASVRRLYAHYCTGSILTKNLVISVAQPLDRVPVNELGIVVGENYSDRGSLVHTVVLAIIHEDFDPYTLDNDLALLRVYEDITYRGSVKPIALIPPRDTLANNRAFVTGWGRCDSKPRELCLPRTSKYFPDEKIDPMLRSISFVIVMPNHYCDGYIRHGLTFTPGTLCVGPAREEDPVCPCMAVPGAPLIVNGQLVGIQSWGFGCGYHHDLPLVYTDMQHYQPWLVHNIPILRKIVKSNLTKIFQATRGYILAQWLIETRLITPELHVHVDKDIIATRLDRSLAKLKGNVYDIRDFISGGVFRKTKLMLYGKIREEFEQHEEAVQVAKQHTHRRPEAFFVDDTLLEFFNSTEGDNEQKADNNLTDVMYETVD